MYPSRSLKLLPLFGLPLLFAAGLTACPPAHVAVTVGPTQPPPVVHPPPVDCPSDQYYRLGRYHWRNGKYVFARGRCVARPASWHTGCHWQSGRWVKRGRTYAWQAGRAFCPKRTVTAHPTALPPPPRVVLRNCAPGHYVQHGHWRWVAGQWRWQPGRCVARPAGWSARGCRYVRGAWKRVGAMVVFTQGRVVCAPAPVARAQPRRCTDAMRRAGRCGRVPPLLAKCPKGLIRFGSKCVRPCRRGQVRHLGKCVRPCKPGYLRVGARCLRKCKAGYTRHAGKCVRQGVRRCTAAMRKAGRCGRPLKLARCKKGYYLHRGKCVRQGVRRCTAAMRKAGRCR